MAEDRNNRETGAQHLRARSAADASDAFSQDAATNKKPPDGMGNAEPLDPNEKTRRSDGQQPPQTSGAGLALAERSKDANSAKDRKDG